MMVRLSTPFNGAKLAIRTAQNNTLVRICPMLILSSRFDASERFFGFSSS